MSFCIIGFTAHVRSSNSGQKLCLKLTTSLEKHITPINFIKAFFPPLIAAGLGMAQKAKLKAALDIHFNDKQSTKASNLPAPGALRSSNMAPRPLDLRTCTHGGAWLRSAPACESMPCAAPPTLSNGKVVPGSSVPLSAVADSIFSCVTQQRALFEATCF